MKAFYLLIPFLVAGFSAAFGAAENGPSARIHWKAQHQEGLYGYLVYRAEKRSGPFYRASAEIIHLEEDGDYEWLDTEVEPGKTYFYYLDTLRTTGEKERFSPVLSKTIPNLETDPNPSDDSSDP